MRRLIKRICGIELLFVVLLIGAAAASAQIPLETFNQALSAIPLAAHDRILAAIETGTSQPEFPSDHLLALIQRLGPIAGPAKDKESILLMLTRAMERGLPIAGLLPASFELARALEEGLPIEGVVLEALKGIAQGSPISVIVAGITLRLVVLWDVRDLLFDRGIFRAAPGAAGSVATALPTEKFDQLVAQIADAISDYLEGDGRPYAGEAMYTLVADRLRNLPEAVVRPEDVDLVLDRIGPPDLTEIALNALS